MDDRHLRQFVAVANTLSFRKAAESLHMAQPPLSIAIRRLEEEIGAPLFERSRNGVRMTALGATLLDDAKLAVFYVEQFKKSAATAVAGASGLLRVGFVGSATLSLLPRVLPEFDRLHPSVRVELVEGATSAILASLEQGRLDLGLVRYPLIESCSLQIEPVQWDRLVAALPPDSKFRNKRALALQDLADENFILYSERATSNLRAQVILACQAAGFVPRIVQEATHVQTVLSLVESGMGVALVPSISQRHAAGNVVFKTIRGLESHLLTAIAIAGRAEPELNVARHFREVVKRISRPNSRPRPPKFPTLGMATSVRHRMAPARKTKRVFSK